MSHHVMLWLRYLNQERQGISPECTPERIYECQRDYRASGYDIYLFLKENP